MKSKNTTSMCKHRRRAHLFRMGGVAAIVAALLSMGLFATGCDLFDDGHKGNTNSNVDKETGLVDDKELRNGISEAEKKHANSNGFIKESDVDATARDIAEAVRNDKSGVVKECEVYDDGVRIKKTDGTILIWQPKLEGTLSCSTDAVCTIQTYEPHNYSFLDNGANRKQYLDSVDSSAKFVADVSPKWNYTKDCENGGVTVDAVKNMGKEKDTQIIYWMGHGFNDPEVGSILWLNEKESKKYAKELRSNELVVNIEGQLGVTAKFVKNNVSGLDGALIVLVSCEVGKDSSIANAFKSAGASTILAFNETVYLSYGTNLSGTFLKTLCTPDANGTYPTAKQALQQARKAHGDNCGSPYYAEAVLFGDDFQIMAPKKEDPKPPSDPKPAASKTLEPYVGVLAGYPADAKFQLLDLKQDGIPELFVSKNNAHVDGVDIYSIQNGKAVKLLSTAGTFGDAKVRAGKTGSVLVYTVYGGVVQCELEVLDGESFSQRRSVEGDFSGAQVTKPYKVNGMTVSESEARRALDELLNQNWTLIGHSTGHSNSSSNRNMLTTNPSALY